MSLARAERWEEEVVLVKEEMRRTLAFLSAKRRWWLKQASRREDVHPSLRSGLSAYASKQAGICHSLTYDFAAEWLSLYKDGGLGTPCGWPQEYMAAIPLPKRVKRRRGRAKLRTTLISQTEREDSPLG